LDGDEKISKEEVKELLRKFAQGELHFEDVISIPGIVKVAAGVL